MTLLDKFKFSRRACEFFLKRINFLYSPTRAEAEYCLCCLRPGVSPLFGADVRHSILNAGEESLLEKVFVYIDN